MKTIHMHFKNLEQSYWNLMGNIELVDHLTPTNLAEEKNRFLSQLHEGKIYNPRFMYKPIKIDQNKFLKELDRLKKQFSEIDHPLTAYYHRHINNDTHFVKHIAFKSSQEYNTWLTQLYGFPTNEDYELAISILKNIDTPDLQQSPCDVSAKHMKQILREKNIDGWTVSLDNTSARLVVLPRMRSIKVKKDALFSTEEIERLIVHEIGVHVTRYENGLKQDFLLFSRGFPDYIESEEGLAILSEKKHKVLSNTALAEYCCRLIAAYLSKEKGFYDIFREINTYLNENDSFDITARIKRGLIDTTQTGGFTKDQIYLTGVSKIEGLKREAIKKLFVGKIGVSDLEIIDRININRNVSYPTWLE